MERVNQVIRSGRVRGRLVLVLILGVLVALLSVGVTVMVQRQQHSQQQAAAQDSTSLDALRPLLAVERLERQSADERRYRNLVYELSAPPTPKPEPKPDPATTPRDFAADYQRYQELTQHAPQPVTPTPPSAAQQAAAALTQSRAQALLVALKASTAVAGAAPRAAPHGTETVGTRADAHAEVSAGMTPLQAALARASHTPQPGVGTGAGTGTGTGSGLELTGPGTTLSAYDQLRTAGTLLTSKVESVLSPYLLRQGVLIPCVLLSGVNSDLPGQVQAQVTSDVFDTPYGRHVLIPKGSKIIGQYAAAPLLGQERLMLGFNRVIFPDGKALSLGAMPGVSQDGLAGFSAEVDHHMWRLFSNAVLLGGITASVSLAVDNDSYDEDGNLTVSGALSQGLGQSLGRVITAVIERNLAISPTLTVAPGFLFNVTLTQDIYFDGPYHGYDYEQQPHFGS